MISFPVSLSGHPRFCHLAKATARVVEHPSLTSADAVVIDNLLRASLVATVCFYRNLAACLRHEMDRIYTASPFHVRTDAEFLRFLLDLCSGELAANNMPDALGFEPHFCTALRAAKAAGIETSFVEALTLGEPVIDDPGVAAEVAEYLRFSLECSKSFEDAFATIAIREITLSESFRRIASTLPRKSKFEIFRGFIESHIELDEAEHGPMIAKALDHLKCLDRPIQVMVRFYELRANMYDACLSGRSLF